MKTFKILTLAAVLIYFASSCNPTDRDKKLGGSTDTSSVNRGGGPAIKDTTTINRERKQQVHDSLSGDTTYKGNVDPSGHAPKK